MTGLVAYHENPLSGDLAVGLQMPVGKAVSRIDRCLPDGSRPLGILQPCR
jgi:hypothetical protein